MDSTMYRKLKSINKIECLLCGKRLSGQNIFVIRRHLECLHKKVIGPSRKRSTSRSEHLIQPKSESIPSEENRSPTPSVDGNESYAASVEQNSIEGEESSARLLQALDPIDLKRTPVTNNDRAFDIYGQCVAAQLKELPSNEAYAAMAEVQALLTKKKIETTRTLSSIRKT